MFTKRGGKPIIRNDGKDRRKRIKRAAAIIAYAIVLAVVFCAVSVYIAFPRKYSEFVEKYAAEFSLDESEVFAVIRAESGFRADALSQKGAVGLMQLMPSTAAFAASLIGCTFDEKNLSEPELNIRLGCKYLSYLKTRFAGDMAYAAYNAGEGRVREWQKSGGEIPYPETKEYVRRVNLYKAVYEKIYAFL